MIQAHGFITGLSRRTSSAVQRKLFDKKYAWAHFESGKIGRDPLVAYDIYWYENGEIMLVPPTSNDLHPHTLADFNLDGDGNELPPILFNITPSRSAVAQDGAVTFSGITLSADQLHKALRYAEKTIK